MSLVTVIQNVEIERHNNKALKEAMTARLDSLIGQVEVLHAAARALASQHEDLLVTLKNSRDKALEELSDRDEALRCIIEGDSHAGE